MAPTKKPKRPAARDLPEWIPAAVRDAARHLPSSDVAERLLTDERMRSVWSRLSKQAADREAIERRLLFEDHLPAAWGLEFSPQERGAAAFFCGVVGNLTRTTELMTRAEADARARPYRDAAALCREMIEDAEGIQRGYDEVGETIDFDLAEAFDVIAGIFEFRAKRASAVNDPHVIERSAKERGDDALRVKARLVAETMFSIYGKRNHDLTAIVTSIATGTDISAKSVENWTAYLGKNSPQ